MATLGDSRSDRAAGKAFGAGRLLERVAASESTGDALCFDFFRCARMGRCFADGSMK
jgi:hypothetical protein